MIQPDDTSERITYQLINIRLYDNDNNEISRRTFGINQWYYDKHTYEFSADHDFQIVVVRSEGLEAVIRSFDERMRCLRVTLNARAARSTPAQSDES